MRLLSLAVLLAILLLAPCPSSGATIHVPADQPTIQAGIDAASPGDTVLVAPGTYTGDGNRDIDFDGNDLVLKSEGGSHVTIIDCEGLEAEPHRGFIFQSGETRAAEVDGFTIRNGYAAATSPPVKGGAVHCSGSSPFFRDCVFAENIAQSGGAVYLGSSSPLFIDCAFIQNSADYTGGGAYNTGSSIPAFSHCIFSDNSAFEAAGFYSYGSRPAFANCTFLRNSATSSGGGFYCRSLCVPSFTDCIFSGNSADCGVGGALSSSVYSHTSLVRCTLSENSASGGGAVYSDFAYLTVSNCTFSANSAVDGGAVHSSFAYLTVSNCTFFGNAASSGGAIRYDNLYELSLTNTIIAFSTGGEAVHCDEVGAYHVLACCDFYGNAGGDWVGCIAGQDTVSGNFSADPLFCDAPDGDFRLSSESPCIIPQLDPACGAFIGAWGVGCGTTGVGVPGASETTWGLLKALFHLPGKE